MRKQKVMHVLCMGGYSGAENVAITIINSLKDKADSVYVSPSGSICDVLKENCIEHYSVESVTRETIKKAIREIQPDIIHAHDFHAGVVCAMSTWNVPIINHLHNNASWIRRLCVKTIAYGLTAWKYKKILTVSEKVMDEYIFGKPLKRKTEVIGNPIDIQKIRIMAEQATLCECSDIMFLGRFEEPKNPVFFVEIVGELKKQIPELKVFMVGDGTLRSAVEQKIKELELEQTITLWGFQKNPYGMLSNTKVMCMPSVWEGFGLAAVEALALGIPVVAAPVGGLNDIIQPQCGSLCQSKEEFCDRLFEILNNVSDLEIKKRAALQRADEYDNIPMYRDKMFHIYQNID